MRFLAFALIAVFYLTAPARAQDDDDAGGFLVNLLQNNLSGDNRYIRVTGLQGALSGAARIREISVSDDEGVWLTIRDAVLDWNRLALVRGRFSVNTLSAAEIIVARKPIPTQAADDLPEPEAKPFQVPELPVAVEIGELRIDRFELDQSVIGHEAALSLNGALSLANGTLESNLEIVRLDRNTDRLTLVAGFQNETSVISLDVTLNEDKGGLVSELLNIPDRPSVLLTVKGEGPVTDFTADVTLASDDVERLGGQVRLSSVQLSDADDAAPPSIGFQAELAGDVTPLLAAEFREFFGDEVQLKLVGRSDPDGRLAIQQLDVLSNALMLNGALDIAGDRRVERVLLQGRISPPRGTSVVLPIGEPRTSIQSALISVRLEAEKDNTWDLRLSVDGIERTGIKLARSEITANGTLDQADAMHLKGTLNAALRGIGLQDEALSKAIGTQVRLDGDFELKDETALKLSNFLMRGLDYSATVDAEIDGLDSGFQVSGTAGVTAADLSRFSALAGRDLTGAVSATINGEGSPLGGAFDFDLKATAQDPTIGIAQVDDLIAGETTLSLQAERDETGLEIRAFDLAGTALSATAKGAVRSGAAGLNFSAKLDDLARLIPEAPGPLTMQGDVSQSGKSYSGTVRLNGPRESFADLDGTVAEDGSIDLTFDALLNQIQQFVPNFPGSVSAKGTAARSGDTWQIAARAEGSAGISATVDAAISGLDSAIHVNGTAGVTAADLSRFSALAGRDLTGAVSATINGEGSPLGGAFDFDLKATAQDPTIGIAQVDDLIAGETTLSLQAERDETGLEIRAFDLAGTALSATAKGAVRSGAAGLNFSAKLDDLARLIPEAPGPLTMQGDVSQSGKSYSGTVRLNGPRESFADLDGTVAEDGSIDLTFDALLARIERFIPEFPGSVSAKGTARRSGDTWQIATRAEGPAGISADVAGSVDQASLVSDITAKGQVQLGAVNRFITPNSVRGTASFDLALRGPPAVESLSGTITTANTSVAIPAVAQTIDKLDATVGLSAGQADVSATAGFRNGGQVRVSGPVSLAPPFQASLVTDIEQLVLTDRVAIESVANGRLSYDGSLTQGGSLDGEIRFGETSINIATLAGSLGAAPIPPMTFAGETGAQWATRKRAGLIDAGQSGSGLPIIGLNVRLEAANKVFVRGRGLQAELGGAILVGGTTAQVAPSGQIDMIRGTMALLGRRLDLTKGILTLQGNLEPYMEFSATTHTSDGDATLEIAGPLTMPKVTVFSDPERPSEEALAMLVFGDQFAGLSPLRIAQLAASLAQLSGSGNAIGEGVREGLGVDTFDIGTDDDGNAQFGAGKYLADGVYTDISINTAGNTEVNLNLDLTDNLTVRGRVDNTGETALGLFFERDY
ncbi:translocation/assembly module TamB domain-containing protein [Sedimentitalea sp. JM2-8]|uniref:Translocation/assembly module TamB domain-containing protein n=1 Tax=Sedimentitalea xiamensis TaxID=3050037 RepID=A0ABT7FB07_9RHOB|nr:translocation/assembly module TamB domain-containing protein [Sedimentitalea xiamensis]MDK3072295.1 translocation/assembly module TamB domain-containing protein [Sedimentitalea xiamensis]